MSRLLDIVGGKSTAEKQTQTGSRLMQIIEEEKRKRQEQSNQFKGLQTSPAKIPGADTDPDEALSKPINRQELSAEFNRLRGVKELPDPLSMNLGDNKTSGGYIANRAISGLESSAAGMSKTRELMQGKKPEIPGLPQSFDEARQQTLSDKRLQDRVETAQAGEDKSKFVQWVGNRAEQIAQQIPNMLMNYASGGAAQVMTAGLASAQAIGNSYDAAIRDGASHEQAVKYGFMAGILEGAVEVLSGGVPGMSGVLDSAFDSITKPITNRFIKFVANQGLNAIGEGLEEGITSALDPLIRRGTFDPAAKTTLAEIANDMLEGFYTSAVMMAPSTIRGTLNINNINNQAVSAELIANATQQGKAYEMLQQKPVSEMTVDEQVTFIELAQEDIGLKQELQDLGLETEQAPEQPTIVSEQPIVSDETMPIQETKPTAEPQTVGVETQRSKPQVEQQAQTSQEQPSAQVKWTDTLPKYTKTEDGQIVPVQEQSTTRQTIEQSKSAMLEADTDSRTLTVDPANYTVDALPNTEPELVALVDKMEQQQKQGIKIDLQLFAAAKDKLKQISQFRTNTLERTKMLTDAEREILDPELFGFEKESVKEWKSEAEFNVSKAFEITKKRIENTPVLSGGVQTYEASLITQMLLTEARKTGDYSEIKEWLPKVAEKTREAARALAATKHAYDPKSPAGAIMETQRIIDDVNDDLSKTDPKIKSDREKVKKGIKKAQDDAGKKTADDIETLSPEELLARRIQTHVKESADTEADPIKDMVNELYRIAQESPLPDEKTVSKRDPMEFVTQAVKNREQYADVFDKAKEIVQAKFKDNPDALSLLDAYFAKEAIPVISKVKMNSAIKNVIRNLGTTIERIAKSSRGTKTEIFKGLATEFMTKGNLTQDEANYLVPFLVDSYDSMVKEKAQTTLANMLKSPTKKGEGTSINERLHDLINMGTANEAALNRVLALKYDLPALDNETINDIVDIYDITDKGNVDEIKEAIVKESGFTGKQADRLRKDLGDLGTERYRAIALAQVTKRITDKNESSFWRKLSSVQAMGHLLNTVTPQRNIYSNTAMAGLEKVSEALAGLVFKDGITKGWYSQTAHQKAVQETRHEGIDIMLGISSRGEGDGKYSLYKGQTFKKGVLSKAEKLMSQTLRLPDVYFYELQKQDAIEKLTALNGGYMTDDIRKQAEYEAAYATFMDDSLPAQLLQGFKNTLNRAGFGKRSGKFGPAEFGLGDLIIKYAKVPGNIMARTLEYSPLGYFKMAYNMYQVKASTGNSPMMQRNAALSFGRATTGTTGLAALGYVMSALGLFVQRKPDEEKGEAALSRAMGLNQGQVNISALGRAITGESTKPKDGDVLVSISFFEPFATTIVAGASIQQALNEGKPWKETLSITTANTFEEMLDMPTMSIIQAMFQESQREGSNFLTVVSVPVVKAIPGFVPQPVRSVAKSVDPTARSTSGKNVFERTAKETVRNIPLMSKLLEPQVDPTGETYKNFTGEPATNLINYLLNPGYATVYKDIPYKDKLRILSQQYPDANIWPRYYAIATVGNEPLTDKEKTTYMEAFGSYYNKRFEKILEASNVSQMGKSSKEKLIAKLEAARKDALEAGRKAVENSRKRKK